MAKIFSKRLKNKFNNLFYIFIFLFILHIIKSEQIECPRDKPILISGNCEPEYCSDSSQCIIANPIIKTQWLNNIRIFGDLKYRYINFASFSTNDMIVETNRYPKSTKRMFYGLKADGSPFFTERSTQNKTPFRTKDINENNNGQFEGNGLVIKISSNENNGKEYYMSVSKLDNYAEIHDFDSDEVYSKTVKDFTSITEVKSLRHAFIPLKTSDSNYYYLFGFIGCASSNACSNSNKFFLQKHKFNKITEFNSRSTYVTNFLRKDGAYGNEVSCFQTENELIICFYLSKIYNTNYNGYGGYNNNKIYFTLVKYDRNLNNEKVKTIESTITDENLFNKCIHLKGEVGIFASYEIINENNYPSFLLMEYDAENTCFKNYLTISNSTIILKETNFTYNLLLNDIIKINENKVIFTATTKSKETLYIIVFNFFGEKQFKIRYYPIELYKLYHYKILFDLRIHNYNNYLALGLSYCPDRTCYSDSDTHYSALIIFSYPNDVDDILNLENLLLNNNNIDIKNLEIDLRKYINIENNIFGYIVSNITITKLEGSPPNYKAYSSKYNNVEIVNNYILEEDENIIFKYTGTEDHL